MSSKRAQLQQKDLVSFIVGVCQGQSTRSTILASIRRADASADEKQAGMADLQVECAFACDLALHNRTLYILQIL